MARWKKIFRDPRGHDIFENIDPKSPFHGRLSVADKSGSNPDNTDDGPLYLQDGDPFIYATRSGFSIKVDSVREERQVTEECEVCINEPLAQWLQDHCEYKLSFACDSKFYTVTQSETPDTVVYCARR